MRHLIAFLLIPSFFFGISSQSTPEISPHDRFQFGLVWDLIKPFEENNLLYELMYERSLEIKNLKETWRPFIEESSRENQDFLSNFSAVIQEGSLALAEKGAGSAYFLYDKNLHPCFVIKPTDEDIFCLNNPKHFASPFIEIENRVRTDIPLYRSAQAEVLSYELAKIVQLEHITPKTILAIVSHPQFFDISERLSSQEEIDKYLKYKGPVDKEKLCSIQEYLSESLCLSDLLTHLFTKELTDEELEEYFDFDDFEDINLFIWITYDNDAHPANFRAYFKENAQIYGLQKIDNGLCFPENHSGFSNSLMYFPNALKPLSQRICKKIQNLPLDSMKKEMKKWGLSSSINAFEERINILKKLSQRENLTYYECNLRLSLLEKKEGILLALSDASLEELESFSRELLKTDTLSLKAFEDIGSLLQKRVKSRSLKKTIAQSKAS